jgi:ESCRT-II complex subunit VPS25
MVENSFFMSGGGGDFAFPGFYGYPPYFTLQPVKETREKQLDAWRELVLDYTRSKRVFSFNPQTFELFENKSINRSLNESARTALVEDLVAKGACQRAGRGSSDVFVLWKAMGEWENALAEWAHRTGRRQDVLTVDELCSSDEFSDEPFHKMPLAFMQEVLKNLEKEKKVMLFQGTDQDDQGVKFL